MPNRTGRDLELRGPSASSSRPFPSAFTRTAMHAFWQPGFTSLHELVLDHLAQPSIHEILPLVALNRHLRALVLQRLVSVFRQVPTVGASSFPDDATLGDFFGGGGGDVSEDYEPREEPEHVVLYMTHYEPSTRVCTFEPLPHHDGIGLLLPTIESIEAFTDMCSSGPFVFQAASNYWFRPALDGKNSVSGLQLAARPDLQPSRTPAFECEISDEPGGTFEDREYRCANGWFAHYITTRYDTAEALYADLDLGMAPTIFTFKSLRVPLLELFMPPTTAKDDLTGAFARYPLARYLK
ncbi:hypothetical protein JCM3770_002828 [Rhodotorula araucariae]